MRWLSTLLIVAGIALVLDAVVTLVWQEPVSALIALFERDGLDHQVDELEAQQATPLEARVLRRLLTNDRRIAYLARRLRRRAEPGDALGRIQIPRLHDTYVMVQGTDGTDLQKGPGHYLDTPLPGVHGTVAVAGHRTTYLAPFRHIDKLRHGDLINVGMPYGVFTYRVERTRIVDPGDVWVIHRKPWDRLVLTACHPLYSAAHRIVVFARLKEVTPRGLAVINSVSR